MRQYFLPIAFAVSIGACILTAPRATPAHARTTSAPAHSKALPTGLVSRSDEAPEVRKPFGGAESNTDYFWKQADVAFHAGDYPRAIACHKAIVALDPTDTESFGVAAWLMWSLGHGDEAIAHIKRGIAANPTNWDMWDEAGQHYDLQKMKPEAADAYLHAVQFIPKSEDSQMLRRRLAHAQEHAGDLAAAVVTWQGLVADFPNEAVNKNNLVRVQHTSGGPRSLAIGPTF